jgi:urease beta subunit
MLGVRKNAKVQMLGVRGIDVGSKFHAQNFNRKNKKEFKERKKSKFL